MASARELLIKICSLFGMHPSSEVKASATSAGVGLAMP